MSGDGTRGGDTSPEARRLDELAALTREYAESARTAYGAGSIAGGAVTLLALAIDLVAAWRWSFVVYATVPAAWLIAVHAARAFYQRHGVVGERGGVGGSRPRAVAFVTVTTALQGGALMLMLFAEQVREPGRLAALVAATLVIALDTAAVPVLYARISARTADARSIALLLALAPGMITFRSMGRLPSHHATALENAPLLFHWLAALVLAVTSVLWIVQGAAEHRSYRRLERRLAALRASTP